MTTDSDKPAHVSLQWLLIFHAELGIPTNGYYCIFIFYCIFCSVILAPTATMFIKLIHPSVLWLMVLIGQVPNTLTVWFLRGRLHLYSAVKMCVCDVLRLCKVNDFLFTSILLCLCVVYILPFFVSGFCSKL